nr:hypothetical protein CFP56_55829 [Quercus suber]
MDSDFIARIQSLNLTEDEDEVITVGRSQSKSLLWSVWKLGTDLKIIDVGQGLFQFKFALESQLTWVMNNRPWSFDGNILVLRRWEIGITVSSVTFPVLPIWIQIWGLPFDLLSEKVGREIGSDVGRVCGRFGHERRSCTASSTVHEAETPYGEWLKASTKIREDHGAAEGGFRPRQTRSTPRSEMAPDKGQADRFPLQQAISALPR